MQVKKHTSGARKHSARRDGKRDVANNCQCKFCSQPSPRAQRRAEERKKNKTSN